ncbi:MAG: chemotaxis protein CheW [Oligoflexia bacterium]|nr:chemotaxis protein CheW [Oligoflexia bacterium]
MKKNNTKKKETEDTDSDEIDLFECSYIVFSIAEVKYAITASLVREIIHIKEKQDIDKVENIDKNDKKFQNNYVKGVIEKRKQFIPIVDIALLFGKKNISYNINGCIIIANIKNVDHGIMVDKVYEISLIKKEEIKPIHNSLDCVLGCSLVQNEVVSIININKIDFSTNLTDQAGSAGSADSTDPPS